MKTRFNSYDIVCAVTELQKLVGHRINQIYDIDNKTYLFRLQGGESKTVLLIESGIRFHTTAFEWPKNVAPSGFSMKLRKHLKNKRLEKLEQLGVDRIVDFQFGIGDAAYHVILELYDRGNVILTDHELTILYILRPHSEGEEMRFAVREKYPTNRAKIQEDLPSSDKVQEFINSAPDGENIRRLLMSLTDCGPAVIDHVLAKYNLINCVIKSKISDVVSEETSAKKHKKRHQKYNSSTMRLFDLEKDLQNLMLAIQEANELLSNAKCSVSKGYIVQKGEEKPQPDTDKKEMYYQNIEYHPYLFSQFDGEVVVSFETFMLAVDEFYSALEGQKIDVKTLQLERDALKKLSNVKKDHEKRLDDLSKAQEYDKVKAELITNNQTLVDNAILAIRSALANQMSWPDIHELVKAAQASGDPVSSAIKQLKLEINHISLGLSDPFELSECENEQKTPSLIIVDVDLGLSAWANARKYYDKKRFAAQKEQKTIDASQKAMKSAEKKTQQTLKDVRIISTISKARKVYWFEKFYWFISSENYLVIGGRDAQQNELIVKRYMRPMDIYVHAEIQGASSVVIRNPNEFEVPPKTLLEAGTMAISYSVAWDAKVVANAYWVRSDQVSKTAPTGEYLGTGSFMVRGKKNFLPSCHLIMGLSLLFKVEESFVENHRGERKVRSFEEEDGQKEKTVQRLNQLINDATDVEIKLDGQNEDTEKEFNLSVVEEEEETDASNFPDTQIKIEHDTGCVTVEMNSSNKIISQTPSLSVNKKTVTSNSEDTTFILAAPSRVKQQTNSKKRREEQQNKARENKNQNVQTASTNIESNPLQLKRGQKGKLKKMKLKYKDQDDEEREMRMQILKSSGKKKTTSCSATATTDSIQTSKPVSVQYPKTSKVIDDELADEVPVSADLEIIDSLTGQPFEDDELLFAIPIVAPYQSLQNYKLKVKITPGTGKRGRAAKTALAMFSKDKSCSIREKDLLKGIKEESLARNIPGKVKLSAPQIQNLKK